MLYNSPEPKKIISNQLFPPELWLDDHQLIYQGKVMPYSKTILSKETLYIDNLSVEIPINEQVLDNDEKYFRLVMSQQLVKTLERCADGRMAEKIFSRFKLNQDNLLFVLRKLSMDRLVELVEDDGFYVVFWMKIRQMEDNQDLLNSEKREFRSRVKLIPKAYQRLMLLFNEVSLGEKLHNIIFEVIKELTQIIISDKSFIKNLFYEKKGKKILKRKQFLYQIDQMIQTLDSLCIKEGETLLKCFYHYLLNEELIKLVGLFFEILFKENRNILIRVIFYCFTYNENHFWKEIIGSFSNQSTNNIMQQSQNIEILENSTIFIELIQRSFIEESDMTSFSIQIIEKMIYNDNWKKQTRSITVKIISGVLKKQKSLDEFITVVINFLRMLSNKAKQFSDEQFNMVLMFLELLFNMLHKQIQIHNRHSSKILQSLPNRQNLLIKKINKRCLILLFQSFKMFIYQNLIFLCMKQKFIYYLDELLRISQVEHGILAGTREEFIIQVDEYVEKVESQNVKLPVNPDLFRKICLKYIEK